MGNRTAKGRNVVKTEGPQDGTSHDGDQLIDLKDYSGDYSEWSAWTEKDWEEWELMSGCMIRKAPFIPEVTHKPLITSNGHAMNPKAIVTTEFECKECNTIGMANICPYCKKPRPRREIQASKWYKCETCNSTGPSSICMLCNKPRPEVTTNPTFTLVPKWHENFISDECRGTQTHFRCANYHCKCECHETEAGHEAAKPRFKVRELTEAELDKVAFYCDRAIRGGQEAEHFKCSGLHCPCYCHDEGNKFGTPSPLASKPKAKIVDSSQKSHKCNLLFPKHSLCDDLTCKCQCHDVKADNQILEAVEKLNTCSQCGHIKASVKDGKCNECRNIKCNFTFMHSSLWQCHTHKAVTWGVVKPIRCDPAARPVTKIDSFIYKCTWETKGRDEWRCIVHNSVTVGIKLPEKCPVSVAQAERKIQSQAPFKSDRCKLEIEFTEGGFPIGSKLAIESHKRCSSHTCECDCHESGLERITSNPETSNWCCMECKSRVNEPYNISTKCKKCRGKAIMPNSMLPVNLSTKWQCPTCHEWIEESMHAKCYQCRQKDPSNPQSEAKQKADNIIQASKDRDLAQEEQDELYWATSRNYYAHKGPKSSLQPATNPNPIECPQCDYDNRFNATVTHCPDCDNHPRLTKDGRPSSAGGGVSLISLVNQPYDEEDIFTKRVRNLRKIRNEYELQLPEINPS